ncbi:microtubule-associated serine/threonine-protein kinase 2-like [Anomaloglossus baeobatrachus]|uniref:microtubule-associated serine/threonine-protein kinase 2-like n=1 Tax=Anomaloglossus baeobatrachus TaxID=238106 RepID=UPI003F506125
MEDLWTGGQWGVILYQFLVGSPPFVGDSEESVFCRIVSEDVNWTCDPAPPPDARTLITALLRKDPEERLGTEGAFEIKEHPFLRDLDFDDLLSQEPEYVPQMKSDVDTSVFLNHGDSHMDMVSQDEDNDSPDYQNFTTSSQRLVKLCTTTTETKTNDDAKSPPECSPEGTPECSPEGTPECSPEGTPECSPEEFPAKINQSLEEEKPEKKEKGKKETRLHLPPDPIFLPARIIQGCSRICLLWLFLYSHVKCVRPRHPAP